MPASRRILKADSSNIGLPSDLMLSLVIPTRNLACAIFFSPGLVRRPWCEARDASPSGLLFFSAFFFPRGLQRIEYRHALLQRPLQQHRIDSHRKQAKALRPVVAAPLIVTRGAGEHFAVLFCRSGHFPDGLHIFRMVKLGGDAEKIGKVEMAEPEHVTPGTAAISSTFSIPSAVSIR